MVRVQPLPFPYALGAWQGKLLPIPYSSGHFGEAQLLPIPYSCNTNGVLETPKLLLLQKIVKITGAKVVLSTNWRYYADLKKRLIQALESFGIECIGDTPNCGRDEQLLRPKEILAWLNAWNMAPNRPPVTQFVAIDDRLLTSEYGGENLEGTPPPGPSLEVRVKPSPPTATRVRSRLAMLACRSFCPDKLNVWHHGTCRPANDRPPDEGPIKFRRR